MKNSIVVLAAILLLSPFVISTQANLSLSNSIAVHAFDTLDGETFISKGVVIVANQGEEEVSIKLSVEKEMRPLDKSPEGEPRTHTVSTIVYFHEIETVDWIKLEKTEVTIPANSSVKVNYTLEIPKSELPTFINKTNGFLCYIGVSEFNPEKGTTNVGVSYRFKVFIMFPILDNNPFTNPITITVLSIMVTLVVYSSIMFVKKIRLKKKEKIVDD